MTRDSTPGTRFFILELRTHVKGLMASCVSRYFTDFRKNCAKNQKSPQLNELGEVAISGNGMETSNGMEMEEKGNG